MIEGRAAELHLVGERLAAARRGQSFTLLVHGEPGSGKSALLAEVAARADGFRVLHAGGRESESALPFAVLHELVRPLMHLHERLPAAQGAALRAALGAEARRTHRGLPPFPVTGRDRPRWRGSPMRGRPPAPRLTA